MMNERQIKQEVIPANSQNDKQQTTNNSAEIQIQEISPVALQSVAQLGKYWLVNLFQSGGSNVYKLDSKNFDGSTAIFQGDPTLIFGSNAIPVSIASGSGITVPASLIDGSNLITTQNLTMNANSGSDNRLNSEIQFQVNTSGGVTLLGGNSKEHIQTVDGNQFSKIAMEQFQPQHQSEEPVQHGVLSTSSNMNQTNANLKPEANKNCSDNVKNVCENARQNENNSGIIKIAGSNNGSHNQNLQDQEMNKNLNAEMLKVNYEDLSQFLSYHEVFGKIPNEILSPDSEQNNSNVINSNNQLPVITSVMTGSGTSNYQPEAQLDSTVDLNSIDDPLSTDHCCNVCGKTFSFRYQLIVHKRYHSESKPFLCQVCGNAYDSYNELTNHGKVHIGGSMFICKICFHVFANDASLERHMKRHSSDKPFVCGICQKTFARKEHLENHRRSHTKETPFKCQFCNKNFTRKEHMVNHVKKHTGQTDHFCSICDKSFTRKEHYQNHMLWHSGQTPHICTICDKKYTRKEHLDNHLRAHTKETPFSCEVCDKKFSRKEHFTSHILVHSGNSPNRCDFCQKIFTRKEHLLNHVRQHTGESPHKCPFCFKSFTRSEHLKNHIRQHTGETPFKCSFCPKAFTRKDHLTAHTRVHTGETPFRCNFCSKNFTRKEHLNNHVRQHTGESPHKCQFCQKTFTRKEHMVNHTAAIHTGLSPHKCQYCQKIFTRKEHLKSHMSQHSSDSHNCHICDKIFNKKENLISHMARTHTTERPFVCTVCPKAFPLKGNLLFHMRSHNKGANAERPFHCDLCSKDFICKGHLVSHRRAHMGERNFSCEKCAKTFVEKGNMLRHMKKHHPELPKADGKPEIQQHCVIVSAGSSGVLQQSQNQMQPQRTLHQTQILQKPQIQHHIIQSNSNNNQMHLSNSVSVVTTSHNLSLPQITSSVPSSHIHQISQSQLQHQLQHAHEITIQREPISVPVTIISHSGEINTNLQLHGLQPEEHSVVY